MHQCHLSALEDLFPQVARLVQVFQGYQLGLVLPWFLDYQGILQAPYIPSSLAIQVFRILGDQRAQLSLENLEILLPQGFLGCQVIHWSQGVLFQASQLSRESPGDLEVQLVLVSLVNPCPL